MNSPVWVSKRVAVSNCCSDASSVNSDELDELLARLDIHRGVLNVDIGNGEGTSKPPCQTNFRDFGLEEAEVIDLVSSSSCAEEEHDDEGDEGEKEEKKASKHPISAQLKRGTIILSSSDEDEYDYRKFSVPKSDVPTTESDKRSAYSLNFGVVNHRSFLRVRTARAFELYKVYNAKIFDNRLPHDLEISWNKRLASTAGLTHYGRKYQANSTQMLYHARIELSCKVIDTEAKLERTLVHEMCHCAAWLIDHVAKPPHGAAFKKWAALSMRVAPHLEVSTCHQYEIFYAHQWQCSSCHQTYGRHSNSIDVAKKTCGRCRGRLVYLGKFTREGTPAQARQQSAFQLFVKDSFSSAQENHPPNTPASTIMKSLAAAWRERRQEEAHRQKHAYGHLQSISNVDWQQ